VKVISSKLAEIYQLKQLYNGEVLAADRLHELNEILTSRQKEVEARFNSIFDKIKRETARIIDEELGGRFSNIPYPFPPRERHRGPPTIRGPYKKVNKQP
jgi:hypothetical protein